MAEKIGDVYYELGVKSKKFTSGLTKAKAKAKKIGIGIAKAFGVATAAMGAVTAVLGKITKDTIRYGVEIDKLTKTLDMPAEKLSALRYAMEQEHGSAKALEKGLLNLTVRLGYAGDGLETYLRYFRTLGIEHKNVDGSLRDTYSVFEDLIDVMNEGKMTTEKTSAIMQLFGARAAKEVIPFMKLGKEEIHKLMREAKKLGIVLSDETAAALKKTDDAITKLKGGLKGIKIEIGTRLAPAIEGFADTMAESFMLMRESIDDVYPSLEKTGEATDTMQNKGRSFAIFFTNVAYKVRQAFEMIQIAVQHTLNSFAWLAWKHKGIMQGLYDFHYKIAYGIAEFTDKLLGTSIAESMDRAKTKYETEKEMAKVAYKEGEKIALEHYDKLALLIKEQERTIAKLRETLGEEVEELEKKPDKPKPEGEEGEGTAEQEKQIALTREGLIAKEEEQLMRQKEIELAKKQQAENNKLNAIYEGQIAKQLRMEEVTEKLKDISMEFGQTLVNALMSGKGATEKLKSSLINLAIKGVASLIPGGSFITGLFGFEKGGASFRKKPAEGMQEGGAYLANQPTMTKEGNIFAEKGTEVFFRGDQWTAFLEALGGNTFVIRHATPMTYVDELKKADKTAKSELGRLLDEDVLPRRNELR